MDSEHSSTKTSTSHDNGSTHPRRLSLARSEDDIATQLLSVPEISGERDSSRISISQLCLPTEDQEVPVGSSFSSSPVASSSIFDSGPAFVTPKEQQFVDVLCADGLTPGTSPEFREVDNFIQAYESPLEQNRVAARDPFPAPGPSNSQSNSPSETKGAHVGERSRATSSLSTSPIKRPGPVCDILNGTQQSPQCDAGEYAADQLILAPPIHPNPEISASSHEVRNAQDNEIQSAPVHIQTIPRSPSKAVNPSDASNLPESETSLNTPEVSLLIPPSQTSDLESHQNTTLPTNYPPVVYPPVLPDDQMDIDTVNEIVPVHEPRRNASLPPNYGPIACPPILHEDRMDIDSVNGNVFVYEDPDRIEISTEDEDDSTEEDEDASSEVSDGDDLKADLESALEGDFDFKGNFAFSTSLPQAPNPGLHIHPLGLIGLPLSPRDALLIKNHAVQAPFGHGERTVVDKEVRDTWEIEPGKVGFANTEWLTFMAGVVVRRVCAELGVSVQASVPKCELYKLLLYETGSHFLPHQDTEKAPGMFATIIIVLPSFFTGGKVHVSHSASSRVYDLAPSSAFTTSMLTWYTDVMHEVKPITSGYRLALSYNLIHTSQGIPRPMLPDMHTAVTYLRSMLKRWGRGGYDCADDTPQIVAYLLKHEYSEVNLKAGALKGEDAHKVSHLRTLAEEFDIVVCLANLSYNVSGVPDDDGGGYYRGYGGRKRNRYYDSEEDSDDRGTPSMMEEIDRSLTISNLVDLNGTTMMSGKDIHLEENSLIPENPFEDETPDETEYEGYMGNGAGTLEYWYKRTVLVLFRGEEELDILLGAGGITYALQTLIRTGASKRQPTADDTKMANYILSRLTTHDKATARSIADFAVNWGDSEMWKKVVKGSGAAKNIDMMGKDNLIRAWKKFSFEVVRSTLEEIVANTATLKAKVDLTTSLQLEATGEDVDVIARWCLQQTSRALASLKTPTKDDVPILISIFLGKGLAFLPDVILPQLVKMPSMYEFWMEFIPSLHSHKNALLKTVQQVQAKQGPQDNTASAPDSYFEKVMGLCLSAAVKQWNSVVAQPRPSYPYAAYGNIHLPSQLRITRITKLVELCITTGHLAPCERLFVLIIKSKEENDLSTKFQKLFCPLIAELKKLLPNRGIDITSPPFGEFFRVLIGSYLQGILGTKGRHIRTAAITRIGCGCPPCADLDKFMASASAEHDFRYKQLQRNHLEQRLNASAARELVTFRTIRHGSPYGLVVTKKPEVVAATQWSNRQKQAKIFLASIGSGAVISKLMGARYPDVIKSLEGTQQFVVATRDVFRPQPLAPSSAVNAPQASTSTSGSAGIPPPVAPALPSTSANKRKRTGPPPIVLGPVIDLTGDDSS